MIEPTEVNYRAFALQCATQVVTSNKNLLDTYTPDSQAQVVFCIAEEMYKWLIK